MSKEVQIRKVNLPATVRGSAPMTGIETSIMGRLNDPMVKDVTDAELYDFCKMTVTKAYADTGYKIGGYSEEDQANELQFQIESLMTDVRIYHPTLRTSEIEIAISRGVRREYGDYFGLSPVVFFGFVKAYAVDIHRQNALTKHHQPEETKEEISKDRLDEIAKECIRVAYSTYLKTGEYEDYGNAVGMALKSLGLFVYSDEERAGYIDRAYHSLVAKAKTGSKTKQEKNNKKAILERLESLKTSNYPTEKLIRIEASKLAVSDFFQGLAFADTDIEEIFKK